MFDWNDLKYFLAVARSGSTLSAAKSLGVNQSTVHRRLGELERQLGCELVRRHPTGYRLTELGEYVRAYATRLEAAAADFERAVSAQSNETRGTVKVTCPEVVGSRLIGARLIEKFNARYPDVRVEFIMSDRILELGTVKPTSQSVPSGRSKARWSDERSPIHRGRFTRVGPTSPDMEKSTIQHRSNDTPLSCSPEL